MAKQSRNTLKSYFETGKRPTEGQYVDLIDTHIILDGENTGSLNLLGNIILNGSIDTINITASGNISSSATVIANEIDVRGHITASGNASIGGDIIVTGDGIFAQVDTGQGLTEVYLMNQNIRTSDNVEFVNITATGNTVLGNSSDDTHTFTGAITSSSDISSSATITANKFIGDGSGLTDITSTNIITNVTAVTASLATGSLYITGSVNYTSGSTQVLLGIESSGSILPSPSGIFDLGSPTNYFRSSFISESHANNFIGNLTGNSTGLTGNPNITVTDLFAAGSTILAGNVTTTANTVFGNGASDTHTFTGDITASGNIALLNQGKIAFDNDTTNTYIAADELNPESLEIYADANVRIFPDSKFEVVTQTGGFIQVPDDQIFAIQKGGGGELLEFQSKAGNHSHAFFERLHISQSHTFTSSFGNTTIPVLTVTDINSSGTITANVLTPTTITNVSTTNITASGDVSSSGILTSNEIDVKGNITASGNISSSGTTNTFGGISTFTTDTSLTGSDETGITIKNEGLGDSIITFENANDKWIAGIDNSTNDSFKIAGGVGGSNNLGLGANVLLTLTTSGSIGIGTETPGQELEVIGNVSSSGTITSNNLTVSNVTQTPTIISTTLASHTGNVVLGTNENTFIHVNGSITASSNISSSANIIANNVTFGGIRNTSLEQTRIPFGGVNGLHTDNSDFLFVVDTLFTPKIQNVNSSTHITSSGNISASGNILGLSGSFRYFEVAGAGDIALSDNSAIRSKNNASNTYIQLNNDDGWFINANGTRAIEVNSQGVIFNEFGVAQADFRVESNDDTHAIFVDGGQNTIELGRNSNTHITASGNISASGTVNGSQVETRGKRIGTFDGVKLRMADPSVPATLSSTNMTLNAPITASSDISASGDIKASGFYLNDNSVISEVNNFIIVGDAGLTHGLSLGGKTTAISSTNGTITASAGISSSGDITAKSFTGALTGSATGLAGEPTISVNGVGGLGNADFAGFVRGQTLLSHGSASIGTLLTTHDLKVLSGSSFIGNITSSGNISSSGNIIANSFTGTFAGALSSSTQISDDISGSFTAPSSSISTRLTNIEVVTAKSLLSSSAQIASDISESLGTNATLIRSLTAAGISGSFTEASSSFSTRITANEVITAKTLISSSDQIASNISESLGTNATLIRSLTAVGISGSFESVSSSLSTSIALNTFNLTALSGSTLVSASAFSSPSQGTLRATINGADTDVDLGLQSADNVTFTDITASGGITASGTIKANSFEGTFSGNSTGLSGTPSISIANITASENISGSNTSTLTIGGALTAGAGTLTSLGVGNINSTGNITSSGNISSSGTITGNALDIIGTSNLDAVDIDGAVQIDNTVTVGVDGTGYDVKFFGDTAGQFMLWDQSADELVLTGDSKLSFHDAAGGENIVAVADGHLEINAGTTLDLTAPTVDINASTEVNIDGNVDLNGTLDISSHITSSGNISSSGNFDLTGNANIDGDLDVDGTTNLDVVDVDGTFTIANNTAIRGENSSGVVRSIAYVSSGNNLIIGQANMPAQIIANNITLDSVGTVKIDSDTGDVQFADNGTTKITFNTTEGHITASGNISSSSNIIANTINTSNTITNHITASENISASGTVVGSNLSGTNTGDQSLAHLAVTGSDVIFANITSSGNISASGIVKALTLEGRLPSTGSSNASAVNVTMTEAVYPAGSVIGIDMDTAVNDVQFTLPALTAGLRYTFLVNSNAGAGVTLTLTSPSAGNLAGMAICRNQNTQGIGTNFFNPSASKGDRLEVVSDGNIYHLTAICSASNSDVTIT